MDITMYATPICPSCKILKTKLKSKNIEYKLCQSEEEMRALGIERVPVLNVDGELLDFGAANKWINNQPIREVSEGYVYPDPSENLNSNEEE